MAAILIIPGNTNITSFINCLTAATGELRRNSDSVLAHFDKVHVLHTLESHRVFVTSSSIEHQLAESSLDHRHLVHHVVMMTTSPDQRLDRFISGIVDVTVAQPSSQFYFDLTGGVTHTKVALGILAFLLGSSYVYILEIKFDNRNQHALTLAQLRDHGVKPIYRQIAGLEKFDRFGLSNLTAVSRIRTELDRLKHCLTENESLSERSSEINHLISLLEQAEDFRVKQEQRRTNDPSSDERAHTRSILFHAAAAAEVLVDLIVQEIPSNDRPTLGNKLEELRRRAEACSPHPIDAETLDCLTKLLLRLRNRAAHWSDSDPTSDTDLKDEILALQSDLGLRLAKSFIWLVTVSIESFLGTSGDPVRIEILDEDSLSTGQWFVGIDGDGTGSYIASCLRDAPDCQPGIIEHSRKITRALARIKATITRRLGKQSVLFAEGDNILFCGQVSSDLVAELLHTYAQETGLTASAGIGRTPYQASIALKLAKGAGGDTTKIVEIIDDLDEKPSST